MPALSGHLPSMRDIEVRADGTIWQNGKERPQFVAVNTGYKLVSIGGHMGLVHRLVAATFLGPCPPDKVVDHIDGCRTNNNIGNLRYITQAENTQRGRTAKLSIDKVREIKRLYMEGSCQSKLAQIYGVNQSNISRIVNREAWKNA